jgi:hypothetical protein
MNLTLYNLTSSHPSRHSQYFLSQFWMNKQIVLGIEGIYIEWSKHVRLCIPPHLPSFPTFSFTSSASPASPHALCSSLHSSERPFACLALSATGRECSIGKHWGTWVRKHGGQVAYRYIVVGGIFRLGLHWFVIVFPAVRSRGCHPWRVMKKRNNKTQKDWLRWMDEFKNYLSRQRRCQRWKKRGAEGGRTYIST